MREDVLNGQVLVSLRVLWATIKLEWSISLNEAQRQCEDGAGGPAIMPFLAGWQSQPCQPEMGLAACISFRVYILPSGQIQADNAIFNSKLISVCLNKVMLRLLCGCSQISLFGKPNFPSGCKRNKLLGTRVIFLLFGISACSVSDQIFHLWNLVALSQPFPAGGR